MIVVLVVAFLVLVVVADVPGKGVNFVFIQLREWARILGITP